MTEQDVTRALRAARPAPPEGFGARSDDQLRRLMEKEETQMKKFSWLTAVLILALALGAATALAEAGGWDVWQFLFFGNGRQASSLPTVPVQTEVRSQGAALRISSAVYDGRTLAFDWNIENTIPEKPMYARVERFTVNGVPVWTDGTDSFDHNWLPGLFSDGGWQDGELILLPEEIAGADTLRVALRTALYRPRRPVYPMPGDGDFDPALAAEKIGEGYYVLAGGEGFVVFDEATESWRQVFMPKSIPTDMGDYDVEWLEAAFDVTLPPAGVRRLKTEAVYERSSCFAQYETAQITPLGLYLRLRLEPSEEMDRSGGNWELTDGNGHVLLPSWEEREGLRLEGETYGRYAEEGRLVWVADLQWYGLTEERLPDVVSLSWLPDEGEPMIFPVRVR